MSKSTISTGGHLIDPQCKYVGGEILQINNEIFSCTLNQTVIGKNTNKFYIMQIIKCQNKHIVYIRYGRIGEKGTTSYKDCNESGAVQFFVKQFKLKTGNNWYDKDNFAKISGKYFLTITECAQQDSIETDSELTSESEINIDERIVDFLQLISNQVYMKNTLAQLEIDTDKMPLGKIGQKQIDAAYDILNKINNNLRDTAMLTNLSSDFYTLIPMATGRKMPPLIDSKDLIGKNINLLNELSQMVYGSASIVKMKKNNAMKNLINLYEDLETKFLPLDKTDVMYGILSDYLYNSKAPTHHFKFEISNIFEIIREKERNAYEKYSAKIKNKTLLFHGTRVSNMIGILKNGLVVDPSKLGINVSITGKMFGMGLYFANSCSKSINYCDYTSSDNTACLFVSEVALGKMMKKEHADSRLSAANLPKQYNSTWGLGASTFAEYDVYDDNTQIPRGKLIKTNKHCDLQYDEFIVYHEEQISLRYIIQLKIA
jgi:poly [ADP-ribose] polymerase